MELPLKARRASLEGLVGGLGLMLTPGLFKSSATPPLVRGGGDGGGAAGKAIVEEFEEEGLDGDLVGIGGGGGGGMDPRLLLSAILGMFWCSLTQLQIEFTVVPRRKCSC